VRGLHAAWLEGEVDTEDTAILLQVKMKQPDPQGESQLLRLAASPRSAASSSRARLFWDPKKLMDPFVTASALQPSLMHSSCHKIACLSSRISSLAGLRPNHLL